MKKTNPLKIVEIEMIANNLRREFGISLDSHFPILEIIEELHNNGLLTIQYMEDTDSIFEANTPAKYNPIDNFIYVKESVLEELENKEYRANFTLAHELFHYFECKVLGFSFEEVETCPSYCNPEWQANEFAGQLLIPTYFIEGNYETLLLAKKFHVTEECVLTRKLYFERRNRKNSI
ncbi:MAG: ImmA/IrrE family metallo-endopeptidase [Anaeroplasmataceae bacterium]